MNKKYIENKAIEAQNLESGHSRRQFIEKIISDKEKADLKAVEKTQLGNFGVGVLMKLYASINKAEIE